MTSSPRIAILGWGSLLWDKNEFFDRWHSEWKKDGPNLPIEFSRISKSRNNALTLVIDLDKGEETSSFYTISKRRSPDDAFSDLRCREKTTNSNIGIINLLDNTSQGRSDQITNKIRDWAVANKFDVVIWTDLISNFTKETKKSFSPEEALAYLKNIPLTCLSQALEYLDNTQPDINTPFRRFLNEDEWLQRILNDYKKEHPEPDSLRAQLTELNNRSRWYAGELWQIPFAYIGLTGLIIAQIADKSSEYLGLSFIVAAAFGVFVIFHMRKIRKHEKRAVDNLQYIETALKLPSTVRARSSPGQKIFQKSVILFVIVYSLIGLCLLYQYIRDKQTIQHDVTVEMKSSKEEITSSDTNDVKKNKKTTNK